MADKVVHFEIPADDVDRAQAFYRQAFGWLMEPEPRIRYVFVKTGAPDERGTIHGGIMKREGPVHHPIVTVLVEDMDAALRTVADAGGRVVRGKDTVGGSGFQAYIEDSEGNVLGLWQSNPVEGAPTGPLSPRARRTAGQFAILTAVIGVVGLALLFTFFAFGGPFGTANDIVAIGGFVVMLPVAVALHRIGRRVHRAASLLAFAVLTVGVAAGVVLQVMLVSGVLPFDQQLPLVLAAGALIGAWYALASWLARDDLSNGLVRLGIVTGVLFVLSVSIFWAGYLFQGGVLNFADPDAFASLHPLVSVGFGLAMMAYLVSPAWAWWLGREFLRSGGRTEGE